jgi:glucose/arabinose dehydrogenase
MKRLAIPAAFLTLTLMAVACGSNDPGANPATTVPVVTEAAGDTTPADDGDVDANIDATPTTEQPAADPRAIGGDLNVASVRVELLAQVPEPVDTAVATNGELWIALREGLVVVLDPATGDRGDTVLDVSAATAAGGERGLLGIATDGEGLYVNYTDLDGNTNVVGYPLDADGRPGEGRLMLTVDQPFPNHNGGAMVMGPDDHLYIGVGDGGAANDPLAAGQDPMQILGSILRVDPTLDADEAYAIPADNPFADGVDGHPEIFMIGARNPWRISFDPITNNFWIADVGQNLWEEVDLLLGANGWGVGGNLGWNLREGTNEFTGERPADNIDPVFEYPHEGNTPSGCSISGGVVYRGLVIPDLVGAYVFGDFCKSSIWAISIDDGTVVFKDLGGDIEDLVGVTADAAGELLVLTLSGKVHRIIPS